MSKHNFSQKERNAVITAHGQRCYMCYAALTMRTMEIDHLIPENLTSDPERLAQVIEDFGLAQDFDINSYENWLPACRQCNSEKGGTPWEATPKIQGLLRNAREKAPKAQAYAARLISDRSLAKAVATLAEADEQGELPDDVKQALVQIAADYSKHGPVDELEEEEVRLTPTYSVSLETLPGPFGVGVGSSGSVGFRMRCPACGWSHLNGARCVMCGQLDDD